MRVLFAADHAGFDLKNGLIPFVRQLGHDVHDLGPTAFDPADDYPQAVAPVARAVSAAPAEARGIILGGSGQGEAIVANRFPGVRAAVYYGGPADILRLSREHNDTNVLSLGARFLTLSEAQNVVALWLATAFAGDERHRRRIDAIDRLVR